MKQTFPALGAVLLLTGCLHSGPSRLSSSSPEPARVLLISYDGVGADAFQRHLDAGTFRKDGFAVAATNGTRALRVIPVTPVLTSVAHVSIATGAEPSKTGIVSNTFHRPGDPIDQPARGFQEEIDVETIWEAAQRQGKKIGSMTYPGLDGEGPRRTADWGLIYTEPLAPARVVELHRNDFTNVRKGVTLPHSFSAPLSAALTWALEADGSKVEISTSLAALDSSDDKMENYDLFFVISDSGFVQPLDERWFPAWKDQSAGSETFRYGSWSKLIESDAQLAKVRVYQGVVCRTLGYPSSYRRMIDERVGFWPGPPDDTLAKRWLVGDKDALDPQIFSEQLARFSRFFTDATLLSMLEMPWDLILGYQPIVDEAEHQFLLETPGQLIQDPEKVAEGRRVRAHAFRIADLSFARYLQARPEDTAIVATGDHGLAPLEKDLRLNRLLVDWGYASIDNGRLAKTSRWAAFTSGSFAQIYSFAPFSAGERDALIQKLRELRDDEGSQFFEIVRARTPEDHANSGEILAFAFPRFSYSSSLRDGPLFGKTEHFGQHGGMNHHAAYHTFLLAYGKGVPRRVIDKIRQTSIARYVSDLLKIDPPRMAQ